MREISASACKQFTLLGAALNTRGGVHATTFMPPPPPPWIFHIDHDLSRLCWRIVFGRRPAAITNLPRLMYFHSQHISEFTHSHNHDIGQAGETRVARYKFHTTQKSHIYTFGINNITRRLNDLLLFSSVCTQRHAVSCRWSREAAGCTCFAPHPVASGVLTY